MLSQACVLGAQVAAALDHCVSNDGFKDSSVNWILLTSLECLQKGNEKLRSINSQLKSQFENQRASMTAHTQNVIVLLVELKTVKFTILPSFS